MSQLSEKARASQAALELIALVSIALLFLSLTVSFYMRERNSALEEALLLEAKTEAFEIAGAIDQVYLGGDGYERNFSIPETIAGYNYTVRSSGGHVYLVLPDFPLSVSAKITTANYSGNFSKGRLHRIGNEGGLVSVNEV